MAAGTGAVVAEVRQPSEPVVLAGLLEVPLLLPHWRIIGVVAVVAVLRRQ